MFSWSELNTARKAVRRRWPTIWRVPRTARSTRFAAARIRPGDRVLDVGASDGRFGRRLPEGVIYKTLDTDPKVKVDYAALEEVDPASMDAVVCFEMIEHVSLEEAFKIACGIARVLRPQGRLFLSTPNIHHPWSYLRSATHRTPFCYDELGGLLDLSGLEIDGIYRCHHDAALKGLCRRLAYPLYRLAGCDYAKSILIVAHRPRESTRSEK